MKKLTIITIVALSTLCLTSCDEGKTKVSKSVFANDTIVSTPAGNGTYTRTQYGRDFFGNREIEVSRGHGNASQHEDLVEVGLELLIVILAEFSN